MVFKSQSPQVQVIDFVKSIVRGIHSGLYTGNKLTEITIKTALC